MVEAVLVPVIECVLVVIEDNVVNDDVVSDVVVVVGGGASVTLKNGTCEDDPKSLSNFPFQLLNTPPTTHPSHFTHSERPSFASTNAMGSKLAF